MKPLLVLLLLTSSANADEFWKQIREIQNQPEKAFEAPQPQKQECHKEDIYENGKFVKTILVCVKK